MAKDKEKYLSFFEENVKEDEEHIFTICSTASKQIWDRFKIRFDDPKLLGTCFIVIYETFIEKLKSLQKEYSDFQIKICDRLEMGYTTNDNEEDEKSGNFMISIKHINCAKKNYDTEDPTATSRERSVHWNTNNIIAQPELLRQISIDAVEKLKKLEVTIGFEEIIIPMFVTVYESLVIYLKTKRKELDEFEFEINFMSCFYIGARESEDVEDTIYIRPNIAFKLELKDDASATAKNE